MAILIIKKAIITEKTEESVTQIKRSDISERSLSTNHNTEEHREALCFSDFCSLLLSCRELNQNYHLAGNPTNTSEMEQKKQKKGREMLPPLRHGLPRLLLLFQPLQLQLGLLQVGGGGGGGVGA